MTKHQRNWIIVVAILLLSAASIYLSAVKIFAAQAESLRLSASNTGCIFGVLTVAEDEKYGRKNFNYDAEEDLRRIDFFSWKDISKKDVPVFKEYFRQSMVACYRRYL